MIIAVQLVKLCFFPTEVDYDLDSCLFSEDSLLSLSSFLNSAACKCGSAAEMDWTWIGLDPDYSKFCWIWIRSGV